MIEKDHLGDLSPENVMRIRITFSIFVMQFQTVIEFSYGSTAVTKGKTPVPVCSPKVSSVGQGCHLDG